MQLPRKAINPVYLLLGWLVLNLLQATFSPLDADETYYWMYASRLDWGYFDHPPAVAVLISLGKDWLPGALGLRFGHVLASTALMAGMWHLLGKPRGPLLWLAAALVFAQPFLNVYGFIATPDGPLLLFSVLYLLAYRRFLDAPSLANGAIWGLTMAGLLYGKYHGLMLIFFTVLPHLFWLLRQPGAWVAALGGAALYLPHLYWQYANDFPSFRYHLSGRDDAYELKFTIEYLLNQLVIFSPLLIYHYGMTFVKDDDRGDRLAKACRWLVVGFLVFFLYTTSKGGTEAQWTALLSIPLVYLTFRAARDRFTNWQPQIFRLAMITVGILIVVRLLLMAPRDWVPFEKPFDHEPWTERLADRAEDRPVIVHNSYRFASLYEFYSGNPAWTFTDVEYRLNQYDLWTADSAFHNKDIYLLGQKSWKNPAATDFRTQKRDMIAGPVDSFQVLKNVRFAPVNPLPDTLVSGETVDLRLTASTPRRIDTKVSMGVDLFVIFHYPDGKILYRQLYPDDFETLESGERTFDYEKPFRIPSSWPTGPVEVEFGLGYGGMPPLRGQSEKVAVVIKE